MSISIYTYIFFQIFFPYRLLQNIEGRVPGKASGFQCFSPPSVLGQYSPLSQMPLAVSHPVCCSKCHDPEAQAVREADAVQRRCRVWFSEISVITSSHPFNSSATHISLLYPFSG